MLIFPDDTRGITAIDGMDAKKLTSLLHFAINYCRKGDRQSRPAPYEASCIAVKNLSLSNSFLLHRDALHPIVCSRLQDESGHHAAASR